MYRLVVIIGSIFILFPASGQEPETFADFNNRTYTLYERKQWKELLETGRKALKNGYDFYYLRMRMGIAAYEKQNYVRAIHHFRKALIFSKNDPLALEYLYYAYLFTGRDIEAGRLTERMPVAVAKEKGYDNKKNLTGLDFSSSYFSRTGTLVVPENTSTVASGDGWRNMDENGGETSVLAEWDAGKNSRIHTGYRFLTKQRNAYILYNGQATYYSPNIYNQHFFYADIRTRIFRDTYLKLSAGYINLRPRYATR
ncbi:MAG: hypothetical protein J7K46_08375, partial [Bacteroidales bacterium]|nr:hypothetical protein [Bacteroidales bacterium]